MKLSIAIPVYNEEERLPEKIRPYLECLEKTFPDYELVLVNDGSTDATLDYLRRLASENEKVKFIHSAENRGRGFGMKTGVLASSGDYILETDADLPVSPEHIMWFLKFFEQNPDYSVAIGSRAHPESSFVVKQPPIRIIFGEIFHFIFGILFGVKSRDVMCGFKMFKHEAAKDIFKYVYDDRYLAAGEVVLVAKRLGHKMKELPVRWEDDKRSKVKVFKDTTRSLCGLGQMLVRDWQGKYDR